MERETSELTTAIRVVEYQEPIVAMEPVFIEGFVGVVAASCSRTPAWTWSSAEVAIAVCWQRAGGRHVATVWQDFRLEFTTGWVHGGSEVWVRATKVASGNGITDVRCCSLDEWRGEGQLLGNSSGIRSIDNHPGVEIYFLCP